MGILSKLIKSVAGPYIIGVVIVSVLGFFIHYTRLVSERDALRTDNTVLTADLAKAAVNKAKLKESLRVERIATTTAAADREEARAALNKLRAGRANDPEAQEWGTQLVPLGELERLCEALPEMLGCVTTL